MTSTWRVRSARTFQPAVTMRLPRNSTTPSTCSPTQRHDSLLIPALSRLRVAAVCTGRTVTGRVDADKRFVSRRKDSPIRIDSIVSSDGESLGDRRRIRDRPLPKRWPEERLAGAEEWSEFDVVRGATLPVVGGLAEWIRRGS